MAPQRRQLRWGHAKPGDYKKATLKVYHAGARASAVELPVVAAK